MTESSKPPSFTILMGPLSGRDFAVRDTGEEILIGSDPSCGVSIPAEGVSPIHARVVLDPAGHQVHDTQSPRGLYVNDDRVAGQALVRNGDVLWLGPPGEAGVVMLQCHLPEPTEMAAPAPQEEEPFFEAAEPAPEVVPEVAEDEAPTVVDAAAAAPEEAFFEAEDTAATAAIEPESGFVETVANVEVPEEAGFIPPDSGEPAKFAVEVPSSSPQPTFEDETVFEVPAAPSPAAQVEETVFIASQPEPTPEPPAPPSPPPPPAARPAPPPVPQPPARPPVPPRPATPPARRPAGPPTARRPGPPSRPPTARTRAVAPPKPAAPMGKYIGIGAAVLVILGGGGYFALRMLNAPKPAPAPPTTLAQATPLPPVATQPFEEVAEEPYEEGAAGTEGTVAGQVPELVPEEVTEVTQPPAATPVPTPTPRPTRAPATRPTPPPATPDPAQAQAQQVANLLGEGQRAMQTGRYDAAVRFYDEVLKLDPSNAQAGPARQAAVNAAAAAKRTFVGTRTSVQAGGGKGGPAGFDSAGVSVANPDYSGRIQFEASPSRVKAGDGFTIRVYLTNNGKKDYKLTGVEIVTKADGGTKPWPATPPAAKVDVGQRALVAELKGVWEDGVDKWSTDVTITTDHKDTFKSRVTWK